MRSKQIFAMLLSALLFLVNSFPVFAAAVDNSQITASPQVDVPLWENNLSTTTGPVLLPELPQDNPSNDDLVIDTEIIPPSEVETEVFKEFYLEMKHTANGIKIRGYFLGYQVGMRSIQPYYSFNGVEFKPVSDELVWDSENFDDVDEQDKTLNGNVADENQSPLLEYLAKEIDTFYIRLHYVTNEGEFDSQTVEFRRPTHVQPLPDDMNVIALYPISTMRIGWGPNTKFQYNVTVKEGATPDDVLSLLPSTLPIELQVMGGYDILLKTFMDYKAEWNLPERIPYQGITVPHAVRLTAPEDFVIEALDGNYSMNTPPMPFMPLYLKINIVPSGQRSSYELHTDGMSKQSYLFMTFPLKPSGATEIIPSYSVDGGETWMSSQDILSYNEAIDKWPKNADYRHVMLFTPEQSPYKAYASGEIDGFLTRINIIGGSMDGFSETVPWPMIYDYQPPNKDGAGEGSGGNENNAGSGNGDENNDSSGNGGQRPDLPDGGNPPVVISPIEFPAESTKKGDITLPKEPAFSTETDEDHYIDNPEESLSLVEPNNGEYSTGSGKSAPLVDGYDDEIEQKIQKSFDNREQSNPFIQENPKKSKQENSDSDSNTNSNTDSDTVADMKKNLVNTTYKKAFSSITVEDRTLKNKSFPMEIAGILIGGTAAIAAVGSAGKGIIGRFIASLKKFFTRTSL